MNALDACPGVPAANSAILSNRAHPKHVTSTHLTARTRIRSSVSQVPLLPVQTKTCQDGVRCPLPAGVADRHAPHSPGHSALCDRRCMRGVIRYSSCCVRIWASVGHTGYCILLAHGQLHSEQQQCIHRSFPDLLLAMIADARLSHILIPTYSCASPLRLPLVFPASCYRPAAEPHPGEVLDYLKSNLE